MPNVKSEGLRAFAQPLSTAGLGVMFISTRPYPYGISILIAESAVAITINCSPESIAVHVPQPNRAITVDFSSVFVCWVVVIFFAHFDFRASARRATVWVGFDFIAIIRKSERRQSNTGKANN